MPPPLLHVQPIERFVIAHHLILHRPDQRLLRARVVEVLLQLAPQQRDRLLRRVLHLPNGLQAVEAAPRGDGLADGLGDLGGEAAGEVVDDGAQAGIELGLGVEHVLDDFGEEAGVCDEAPEVAGVEEAAAVAELVEGGGGGGEVEGDVGGDVFDVEGDDLLFEDEEVLEQEELAVEGGGAGGDEGGGVGEGEGGLVDDLVGEVVEDGGLGGKGGC